GGKEAPAHDGDILAVTGLERHKRKQLILKPRKALEAYTAMLRYYVFTTFAEYLFCRELDFAGFKELVLSGNAEEENGIREWVNMGGQIVPAFRVDKLRYDIGQGRFSSWDAIHDEYRRWNDLYELDRLRHAGAIFGLLGEGDFESLDRAGFIDGLKRLRDTKQWICAQVYASRAKDFFDPFRKITYRNQAEMDAVAGKPEDNFFVKRSRKNFESFEVSLENLLEHL
ncbi:MAG: DUF4954 family protein, partial [Spirochaetaceae bacterium]|nr:DUF4954 family protein [Spirochaetaceae bacterium]